jgi:hypothetical protein
LVLDKLHVSAGNRKIEPHVTSDPLTDEVRAIRKKLAAECGNDLARIFAAARQREPTDGRVYVTLAPRRHASQSR